MAHSTYRQGYSDAPSGQIHWRAQLPQDRPSKPPLYCLHPAPFSGLAFATILPHLAKARVVVAPDYPGHGGSHRYIATPSIADYAQAMAAVMSDSTLLDSVSDSISDSTIDSAVDSAVDLVGFHTGCLVAVECALLYPQRVRRLVLIDSPAFDKATRSTYRASTATPFEITAHLDCLEPAWERGVSKRLPSQSLDSSFAMFVEQLRHGRNMNAGFHAAFSYAVEDRLPQVAHPTKVLASQSPLLEATRRTAELIVGARLVERLDVTRSVLDEAAEITAEEILSFLDSRDSSDSR